MKQTIQIASYIIVGVLGVILSLAFLVPQFQAEGSVSVSDEYMSTTTGESSAAASFLYLKGLNSTPQPGALGSVVVTGAGTGWMELYDATTTDADLRSNDQSTSTILLAHIPVSAAAGTYVFDAVFTRGLTVYMEGTQPTTTITWR